MDNVSKPNGKSHTLLQEDVGFQSAMQKAGFAEATQKIYRRAFNKFTKRLDRKTPATATLKEAKRHLTELKQHDEESVTLRYRKSDTNEPKTLRLVPMEFLRRFLQHVLPSRFCKVRHYGLQHSSKRGSVKLLQAAMSYALGVDLPKQPEIEQPPPVTCPKCEAVMTFEKRYTQRERLKYLIAAPRGPPS